ncbi:MAG: hypothetical protein ACOY3U_04775, partial [Bacillota bacterium]
MRVKGNQTAVLDHFKYVYTFSVHPEFHAAIPAVILVYPDLAGGFPPTNRAVHKTGPLKINFLLSIIIAIKKSKNAPYNNLQLENKPNESLKNFK